MPKPPAIRVLDELTAARIAAGEVVERPASVVKELVENSLDAGATDIRVEIQAGGRRLIRVSDNGGGIPADQVELAFEPHATSKILTVEDLDRVTTLGFRGEALTSIAAVCHVTIVSRTAGEDSGVRLQLDNGQLLSREAIGSPRGTIATAENLFHAVPARLKFLKSDSTEAGRIHDIVTRYALAYPDRRFLMVRDGRTVFQSPGTGELADTLIAVFGVDVAKEMIRVRHDERPGPTTDLGTTAPPVAVAGFVSPPHIHRASRAYVTLFLNGRWIHDTSLTYAVIQAYHTLLPKGRYPLAIVTIALPPEAVDVNVHPAKTEVRFRDSRPVFRAVEQAVRRAVVGGAPVARIGHRDGAPAAAGSQPPTPARRDPLGVRLPAAATPQASFLDRTGARLPMLRVVGQLAQSYIVAEGPDGMYLVDQHAAHERVMYEELRARPAGAPSQPLLAPEAVPVPPSQMAVVESHAPEFAALGFQLEPFGPDTVLVRGVPEGVATTDVPGLVASVLDATIEGGNPLAEALEERLIRAVCKQATIKAGQTLSLDEMRTLVGRLEVTASPRTCPHGRPTMIVMSRQDLAREFGRG